MGLPRWPFTTGTTTWPAGRFLNAPISSVRSLGADQRLVGEHDEYGIERSVERGRAYAHGALLPVGVRLVVRERHDEASHLLLDRVRARGR